MVVVEAYGVRRDGRLREKVEFGVLLEEGTSVGVGEEMMEVLAVCDEGSTEGVSSLVVVREEIRMGRGRS